MFQKKSVLAAVAPRNAPASSEYLCMSMLKSLSSLPSCMRVCSPEHLVFWVLAYLRLRSDSAAFVTCIDLLHGAGVRLPEMLDTARFGLCSLLWF